ncbi:group II truncated hemoglobin [Shewanella sp. AS16]|uniref:group II truncated hemoglobin n=1 Tax=Shewanella sp. AS16 TaxID=2907625 RepID=UPI001F2D76D7|nr:group II truncated hemoglobin [Shewanella sp. AS16]MCE9688050.1 group II truncated hemoglobin [Shewanella sp. AS16]
MNWFSKLFKRQTSKDDRDPKQSNAYELIGGEPVIRALAQQFYLQMQRQSASAELLAIHRAPLAQSEQKLFEFLSGWLGGPQLYQQKYGHPALRARHMSFAIDEAMRDQWLLCMKHAIEETIADAQHRDVIYQAISTLADHMRNR